MLDPTLIKYISKKLKILDAKISRVEVELDQIDKLIETFKKS